MKTTKAAIRPYPTVLLLWISPYLPSPLPISVLREIHDYLQGPFLAQVTSKRIAVFDMGTRTWRANFLHRRLEVIHPEAFLMITHSHVFIAGYCGTETEIDHSAYIIHISGAVEKLPDMPIGGEVGLFHYQATNSVLAFGGGRLHPRNDLQSFSLSSRNWSLLEPKMKYPRCSFFPCEYRSFVFLVGGQIPQIELFSLKTFTFSILSEGAGRVGLQHIVFPCRGNLLLLSKNKCAVFSLNQNKYTRFIEFQRPQPPTMNSAWVKNAAFTVDFPYFWEMDFMTLVNHKRSAIINPEYESN